MRKQQQQQQQQQAEVWEEVVQRPELHQQQKLSSDQDFGLPAKRAKLSPHDQPVESLDCEPAPCQSSKVTKLTSSRGAGGLCSSTLEKLKGFTCAAEPGVTHSDTRREKETGGVSGKNCDRGSTAWPPLDVPDQHSSKERLQNTEEEEREDEEEDEEVKGEESSALAAAKQVPTVNYDSITSLCFGPQIKMKVSAELKGFRLVQFAKSGKDGGGGKAAEPSPPSDRNAASRPSKLMYTPLEQQVVQLKQQHKDALLAVECGYKYRFFGEDAEIAAKELNIFCHLDHNFMTCSIPTHRLFVHVRRLVSHGHKVGVVKQTEMSAIKASGASRNTLFTRQLSALYTKSTLVGEDVNPVCRLGDVEEGPCGDVVGDPPESFLLCISENWDKLKKQLTVGLVAVQPSTGDVLMDCFADGQSRSELEARVLKINPVEILVPSDLSEQTQRLLQSITNASRPCFVIIVEMDHAKASRITVREQHCSPACAQADDRVRVEKRDRAQFEFASAMNTVTEFYCHTQEKGSWSLSSVASMESPVICCLGPLIQYLQDFNLERVLRSESSFQHLSCESECMILSAATLRNLEILNNQSSTQEFYLISSSLCRVGLELQALVPAIQSQISSKLLQGLLLDTPNLLAPAHSFLKVLNEKAAKTGNKTELFSDLSGFPVLQERREQIQSVLGEIQDHRKEIRLKLKAPALDYATVSGQEFLIEVKNSQASTVPPDWVKISSTKAVGRYHSAFLVERYKTLQQLRGQLLLDCQREWIHFLEYDGHFCRRS
ncbi:hypothetical protein F2P81_014134 [Scophthalmus maximus]|uniref:DNA mismatch repair protein MSH3 n=1 Tax=Scophthalmus maximus TaxID=52904 RepID=A0A6A4SPJ1_SCOMX|nr:hypothetical protein F2P81_014134 [Scophthalmus maximus]